MSTARQITSLPRAGAVSLADEFAIWQAGRTRICDVNDLLAFLQIGLRGPAGEKGEKGDKGDTVVSTPGGDVDLTPYARLANPNFTGTQGVTNLRFHDQISVFDEYDPNSQESRIKVQRTNSLNTNYTDMYLFKDTRGKPSGTAGNVSTMLRIEQQVGSASAFQWPLLVRTEISGAANGANHVGITSQMYATADTGFYGMCGENRDGWENPATASVAFELDIYGKGGDNAGNRVGLDLVYGAYYPLLAGDHTINCGVRISPLQNIANWVQGQSYPDGVAQANGRALMRYGLQMKGNIGTGIDLSGIRSDYSSEAIYMSDGQFFKWGSGAQFGFFGDTIIINPAPGGLRPGGAMPGSMVGSIVLNVGGLGRCRVPLIAE